MSADANVSNHLANERTFLAWFRTAISLLGFGVVIAKLRFLEGISGVKPGMGVRSTHLGLAFAFGGLLTLVLAAWNYYHTKNMIDSGNYQPPMKVIIAFSGVAFALGFACVIYLLTISK